MDFEKGRLLSRFKWHLVVVYIALIAVILLVFFTNIFRTPANGLIPQFVWFLIALTLLFTAITVLSKLFKVLGVVQQQDAKLEKVISRIDKNRQILLQLERNTRLTEAAKAIAFRDDIQQILRQTVYNRLQQQDFDSVNKIITEIADSTPYKELARQLRIDADRYCDSSDHERVNQVITHLDKLLDEYRWIEASELIEKLIEAEPESQKAKEMRQRLVDKKAERKKILLTAWDDAVKRQATDRSLEILRELDMYLTPNEGIALQEAARDVFRNKLHNLGVQFSLAVSGKQWQRAIDAGRGIIRDFPNSKMAEEIRNKMPILKEKMQQ